MAFRYQRNTLFKYAIKFLRKKITFKKTCTKWKRKIANCTHPCLSTLFGLFFDCKLSSDFAVYRLFCSSAEDGLFVGEVIVVVTKSPVLFHRFANPVGLVPLLWEETVDGATLLLLLLLILLIKLPLFAIIFVECTEAGRGKGEGAGEVLLCESAECKEPFDWWWRDLLFKLVTLFAAWNLEGEFVVVLLLLLLLRLNRQSSSVVADGVIWVERTGIFKILFRFSKFNVIHVTSIIFYSCLIGAGRRCGCWYAWWIAIKYVETAKNFRKSRF